MKARPEDDPNATQGEGAGVVGSFPGSSIFPFTLGMGAFFVVLALVFGIWFLVPGLGLAAVALLGATARVVAAATSKTFFKDLQSILNGDHESR